ncbi:MAG TPA: S8 family serine peptidase [Candidatus Deferrimicrobium sp.]|nr:S8 family serine peptidase [Candidatus Deferrimicrobium sp.]
MEKMKNRALIGLLIIMVLMPSFLYLEISTDSSIISPLIPSYYNFNNSISGVAIQTAPKMESSDQKISLKFQELLKTQDLNQKVRCIVLLKEQPTCSISNLIKDSFQSQNRVLLQQTIYQETKKQIQPMQDTLNIPISLQGGKILQKYVIINALYIEIPLHALSDLAKLDQIARIEPDYQLQIQLDDSREAVLNNTASFPGWDYSTYNGSGIIVAVCDTGIDKTHPNLIDRVINESSFVTGEDTDDYSGHGTHVAGIIASNNTLYHGITSEVSLVNVKVMNSGGTGYTTNLYSGLEWLFCNTSHSANIINLSAGTTDETADGDSALSLFLDMIVSSYDVVWVNAAGNSGSSSTSIEVPGDARNCISVANFNDDSSLNPTDWTIATSSSRGYTADGRKKPDIAAPGEVIYSCNNNWEGPSQDFVSKSGTSMSTPHVAGAAALLWQYCEINYASLDSHWYPLLIKGILVNSAYDLGTAGYDTAFGYGAIDMGAARKLLQTGGFAVETLDRQYGKCKYRITLDTPQFFNATLVWNRHGTTNYTHNFYYYLSNMNLKLLDSTGNELASSSSSKDNVEHISLFAQNGTYYLIVEVAQFNYNPEEYAVVASSPLTFIQKIRTWELYEILLIISIAGIILVIAAYIILWLRERKAEIKEEPAPELTSTWPDWSSP